MRARRWLTAAMAALTVLALPAPALAGEIVTLETESDHVDPASVQFNGPPPGWPAVAPGLRANVLLPDGYDAERAYPVLYLLHGHGDTYAHWASTARGDVQRIAAGLEAIVVMPEAARGWYANWWNGGLRGDPGWERYHLDELIPLIESRFRILPGRSNRAIAGLSMGGQGAVFYATQRPGYFGSAASFSGSLSIRRPEWPLGLESQGEHWEDVFGDPFVRQRWYWEGHDPVALAESLEHTRVYVAVGDGVPGSQAEARNWFGAIAEADLRQHAEDFVRAARDADVDVQYAPRQGIHDWPYWRQDLADALAWDPFEPVPEAPSGWTYETVAQHAEAWGCSFDFAEPPEALARFVRDGGVLRAAGAGTVRVRCAGGTDFEASLPFERTLAG